MKHRRQFIFLLVWPLVAVLISFVFNVHPDVGHTLFVGIPAILLVIWAPRYIKKVAIFSAVFLPLWLFVEHVMHTTGQWYALTAFPNRLLGSIAWESPVWFFFVQVYVLMFWEYFFEHHKKVQAWGHRMKPLVLALFGFLIVTTALWFWFPKALLIPYFYFVLMLTIFVLPLALELRAHPKLIPRFLKVGSYFAYVFILYEITAVALGHWWFPSDKFIGWVQLFGSQFPFEEFISWILIGSMTCLAWYEHFDDDEK